MSEAIKALYRRAGFKPPKGKGIHTKKFHEMVVYLLKKKRSAGSKVKKKIKNVWAVAMSILGKERAVKKAHRT